MASILLKDIRIDDSPKDVLIQKGLIAKIEPAGSCANWNLAGDFDIMDCSGMVAIPGFVNMHTHSAMSLMRGIGEDIVFSEWIDKIWKVEENVDNEFVYWATKVACIEMIKSGTTTFNDQYWHFDASLRAAREMGIRIATGYDVLDKLDPREAARQKIQCIERTEPYLNAKEDLLVYQLAFHAVYSVREEMMTWLRDYAAEHKLKLHIHLSETEQEVKDCKAAHGGLSPVEYLNELGLLSENLIAAHTLWLSEHDIQLLAENKVNCVHNINSNTKLASGYRFLYNELRDAGVNICIGTDGCASSNNLDILEAMKTSAIFQKAWRNDPKALPLNELMDVATINGAKALGINSGRLAVGAIADISIVNTENTLFLSPAPFLANLVYSAHSDCIDSVICNGKFIMRHREIDGEKEIISQARKMIRKIT